MKLQNSCYFCIKFAQATPSALFGELLPVYFNVMRVTALQRDIVWASPQLNLQRAEAVLAHLPATDLVVLPEMFATGFGAAPEEVAMGADGGMVLQWMRRMARQYDCAVAGSVAVERRNRFYFVMPDGTERHYDKHHLFFYGGERSFEAGQERVVVEWRGVRFLLMVCYDLRFPLWNRCFEDYDVALYVASWPTARITQWATLLRSRAIENQCYVVGVNRVGTDPVCDYPGQSAIIHPFGHDIVACPTADEDVITADLDMEALRHFRDRFPVLRERDMM